MSFELNISLTAVIFAFSYAKVNYISDKIEFEFFNYGKKPRLSDFVLKTINLTLMTSAVINKSSFWEKKRRNEFVEFIFW